MSSRFSLFLLLIFSTFSCTDAADYIPPENRTTHGQKVAIYFFMTTCLLLAAYAIWLHRELAKVTIQRIFGGMTAPLLPQQQQGTTILHQQDETMDMNYRPGDYQVPLTS